MKLEGRNNGNSLILMLIIFAAILLILIFSVAIFMGQVNSTLYNLKLEMFSINKAGILAVNKNITKTGEFSYEEEEYRKYFVACLKQNYDLDTNLSNPDKLISKITIKEYQIYTPKERDSYTNEKLENTVLHTVIEVKLKPIILKSYLEKIFTFEIHEDVNMNLLKMR